MTVLEAVRAFIATCSGSFFMYAFTVLLLLGLGRKKVLIGYLCFAGLCVRMLFLLFIRSMDQQYCFLEAEKSFGG